MKVVVTGGGGFVGRALCLKLKERGFHVVSISRRPYAELEAHGIQVVQCDVSTAAPGSAFFEACEGAAGVFHVAAKVDMWGPYQAFVQNNVVATRNVIAACRSGSVKKLILTSSPSVVSGHGDLNGVDESHPYPKHYLAYYPETKAIAERNVLAVNGQNLWTCALRPHLIFGPGDTHLLPSVLAAARSGKLIRIGSGENKVDFCFIDDCVQAHLKAFDALDHTPAARGKAYFISQDDPIRMWDWIDEVLARSGIPRITRRVPYRAAYMVAGALELLARAAPGLYKPTLTRFLVHELASAHWFNIGRAKELLGYQPSVSVREGIEKTFQVSRPAA